MDEKKKRELERLRKQIDPKVLARVAKSMGAEVPPDLESEGKPGDTAKPAPSRPAGSGSVRMPAPPPKKAAPEPPAEQSGQSDESGRKYLVPEEARRSRQMQELAKRIRRREQEVDAASHKKEKKIDAYMVVFDENHFRAKQISGYLSRAEFSHHAITSDLATFVNIVLTKLNDENVIRVVFAVSREYYKTFQAMLQSEDLAMVREKIPGLVKLPVFVFSGPNESPIPPEGVEQEFAVSMKQHPSFNTKKIRKALHIS
ncbi:hypothetical protein GF324_10870 [bacterium]|nr:hypothetical protein [bacterium]